MIFHFVLLWLAVSLFSLFQHSWQKQMDNPSKKFTLLFTISTKYGSAFTFILIALVCICLLIAVIFLLRGVFCCFICRCKKAVSQKSVSSSGKKSKSKCKSKSKSESKSGSVKSEGSASSGNSRSSKQMPRVNIIWSSDFLETSGPTKGVNGSPEATSQPQSSSDTLEVTTFRIRPTLPSEMTTGLPLIPQLRKGSLSSKSSPESEREPTSS